MKCDLCGTNVKVVGHTTLHYEPDLDGLEARIDELTRLASYGKLNATTKFDIDSRILELQQRATAIREYLR